MFGLLNVNKPSGWTSRDVVNVITKMIRPHKAGHAGTLDPLATGVLPVCVGRATRLIAEMHESSKSYLATFLLGHRSPTDDMEGVVEPVALDRTICDADVLAALPAFTGLISQVPPAFSAIRVQGRRAYDAARRGETVHLEPRQVMIHRLELVAFDFPNLTLAMDCSTGTYVRSLGRDLARALGTETVMTSLTRTAVGPLSIGDAVDIQRLRDRDVLQSSILDPSVMLGHLPTITLPSDHLRRLRHGQRLIVGESAHAVAHRGRLRIVDDFGNLAAIASLEHGMLMPAIVFPDDES